MPIPKILARAPAWRPAACALAAALLASCGGGGGDAGGADADLAMLEASGRHGDHSPIEIRTVNNRADLVSGGDAMVEVTAPASLARSLKVTLNGQDVTSAFTTTDRGRIAGLVTGLVEGRNVIEAGVRRGPGARLVVTNAPRHGPVLSGTQVTPFYCATPEQQAGSGNTPNTAPSGLGAGADANCNVPTETKLYYRTTLATCTGGLPDPFRNSPAVGALAAQPVPPGASGCWKAYTPGSTPADLATVTTDEGRVVPFVVRVERGTMNRGIYDIAVLYDASKPWTALKPQQAWNGKVYYSFGASTGQPRRQVRPATAWTSVEEQLKRGYLVVQNSMTDSARNSNRVMMSETVMMMKEHIADTYGPIKYTLGTGCSGGSINSNMNASINPGLLDGIVTSCTYPDSETTSMEVADCTLLVEAYQRPEMAALWGTLAPADVNQKKAAINGHPDQSACHGWYNAFGSNGKAGVFFQRLVVNNTTGAIFQQSVATNNCELPNTAVYNPADPSTANLPRCNAWSWAESIWGRVPGSPAARDTRDNVGVQYGYKALLAGTITAEEFVTLNEVVGGTDRDSAPRAARTSADTEALAIAYRAGIVASGRQLAKTPIIDLRGWDDSNIDVPPGQVPGVNQIPIHHQWFSWAVRDRIERDYGDAGNQALWRFARTGLAAPGTLGLDALDAMDEWLTELVADDSRRSIERKVRNARPASTRDFCLLPSDTTQSIRIHDQAVCDADPYLRPTTSPRQVAGGPRTEDVLKCRLKALRPGDYPGVTFTGAQWNRLETVFATGVCDWSKRGVGQQAAVSPLTFRAGPGGQPLPPAPESTRK